MADFPTPDVWMTHRVSYGETDCMGVLYYAEYFHIFERGRNEYIRAFGVAYKDVEARGLYLPVRETGCRYRSSGRYDDLLHLRIGLAEWGRASVSFAYEIYDESKTRLMAEATSEHACVDAQGRILRTPEWFRAMFPG